MVPIGPIYIYIGSKSYSDDHWFHGYTVIHAINHQVKLKHKKEYTKPCM